MKADRTIDCTGLFCPMPIVKVKREITKMKPGEILEIIADDPGFEKDLPSWCAMSGEIFLSLKKDGPIITGYIQKK